MRRRIELLRVCFILGCLAAHTQGADMIRWETDLQAAFEQAQATNRPLLLHFWTPECVPCKRLEQTAFNQPRVASAMHDHFVPVKIDANQYPELAARYGIKSVPKDIVLTADDQELHRMLTPQDPEQYVAQLSAVAFRAESSGGPPPHSSLAQNEEAADPRTADRRWADQMRNARPEMSESRASTEYTADRPESEETPREVINRFARRSQDAGPTPSARDVAEAEPQDVVRREPMPERPPARRSEPQTERTPAQQVAANQVATAPPTRQMPVQTNPLGLDGYCPVTLLEKNGWVKGDPQYGVRHRGRLYFFAGPNEKAAFYADPDEYSPVLGGVDAVHLAQSGEAVIGERAHGVVYRKRVYLFSTEGNLEQFWQEPERYASPIRQAMETGDVSRLFR